MGFPDRERTIAPPGFNRWLIPAAAGSRAGPVWPPGWRSWGFGGGALIASPVPQASDVTGRKRIYMMYLGVGAVLCTVLAFAGSAATVFYVALAFVIISFYGGGFATVRTYLRDLLGRTFLYPSWTS